MPNLHSLYSVLCLTPWFPNRPGIRTGNFVYESARALHQVGCNVSVLVSRPWLPWPLNTLRSGWQPGRLITEEFLEFKKVQVHYHFSIPRNSIGTFNEWNLRRTLFHNICDIVERNHVEIIHAHTEMLAEVAVKAARSKGISALVSLHGINTGDSYFTHASRRAIFQKALDEADRVILVGEPLRPFFKKLVGRDDHFRVVHNGFIMSRDSCNAPVLSDPTLIRFISVSNLHEGKGIDINIKALAQIKAQGHFNWTYTVVGDGKELPELRRLVQDLGLGDQITFLGARPHSEIQNFLAEADVFILPSYREAFGIAYLEAMASGLLATGVQGQGPAAFITHGETGLLVPPHDPGALANELASIMQNPGAYQPVAEAGRRWIREQFTWTRHAESLVDVYNEILS